MAIPPHIAGQKYISLTTFKKDGTPVRTPVWFGERDGKLYVITRNDSWKYKRIRNNPQVQVAPCSIRGKVTGPDFSGLARILPPEDWKAAHKLIKQNTGLRAYLSRTRKMYFWRLSFPREAALYARLDRCRHLPMRSLHCYHFLFPFHLSSNLSGSSLHTEATWL